MKELIAILSVLAAIGAHAFTPADFATTDIQLGSEGFVEVQLDNQFPSWPAGTCPCGSQPASRYPGNPQRR